MKRILFPIFLITLFSLSTYAHSGKARYHTIVDTDCAADDLRTLCMILASPEFEVLAITTSDGVLTPREGYIKVTSLLDDFGHQGIAVAYGENNSIKKTACHELNLSVSWGSSEEIKIPEKQGAKDLIRNSIIGEEEKVLLICLGPLTNIVEVLKDNDLASQIEKIIWYCDDYLAGSGFNYELDILAAEEFSKSKIEKIVVSNNDNEEFILGDYYLSLVAKKVNKYVNKIYNTHVNGAYSDIIAKSKLKFWDDLIPVYLLYPQYFNQNDNDGNVSLVLPKTENVKEINNCFYEILNSKTTKECKVFSVFPIDKELYAEDVAVNMQDVIEKYGRTEWRAGVLTNELHGHLGIYAIIGVKMGIRVREYFNIGVDDIMITSYAGTNPPTSCMNDGLQVSVGATIGHGLIEISDNEFKRPEADFQFKDQKIKLRLKDKYCKQIQNDVKEAIKLYGNLTPDYWLRIRELAIVYWLEFDRMKIFDIEEQKF